MSDFDKDKSIDDAWLQDLYQSSSRDEQTPNSIDQEILELAAKKSRSTGTWLLVRTLSNRCRGPGVRFCLFESATTFARN